MAETLALYNDWQRDFPLLPHPFAHLAAAHQTTEATVLTQLAAGLDKGEISRIGAVFAPNRIGVSTLAALAVPPRQLEAVAAQVNQHPEVNHNYARAGHRFNLWFVLTARHRTQLETVLDTLRHTTRRPLLDLPLVREYHIDLGFSLTGTATARPAVLPTPAACQPPVPPTLTAQDWGLIAALEAGLPLVHAPLCGFGAGLRTRRSRCAGTVGGMANRRLVAPIWRGFAPSGFGLPRQRHVCLGCARRAGRCQRGVAGAAIRRQLVLPPPPPCGLGLFAVCHAAWARCRGRLCPSGEADRRRRFAGLCPPPAI